MLLLRIAGIVVAIAIAAGIVSYLFTGEKAHLNLALKLARYALFFALAVFALMFFERVAGL